MLHKHIQKLDFLRQPIIPVEELLRRRRGLPVTGPAFDSTEGLAAVFSTSGTTWMPKGWLLPQRQIAGYTVTVTNAFPYDQYSRVFNFATT